MVQNNEVGFNARLKIAIYLCVLDEDKLEEAKEQLKQMRKFAQTQNWEIYEVYQDSQYSESHRLNQAGPKEYLGIEQMMMAAKKGKVQGLLFWSLDRLIRRGSRDTLQFLNLLAECKVCFRSFTEPALDSCCVAGTDLALALQIILAQDGVYISDRTKRGLERQRRLRIPGSSGQVGPGRPPLELDIQRMKNFAKDGWSYQRIADACGCSKATVSRIFKRIS